VGKDRDIVTPCRTRDGLAADYSGASTSFRLRRTRLAAYNAGTVSAAAWGHAAYNAGTG